jgi:hypothetical protein
MKRVKSYLPILMILSAVSYGAAHADDQTPQKGFPPQRMLDHPRNHPRMQLTAEQKTCLEGKLGKPGQGERPSKEVMDAAFKSCGVAKPAHPPMPSGGSGANSNSGQSGE